MSCTHQSYRRIKTTPNSAEDLCMDCGYITYRTLSNFEIGCSTVIYLIKVNGVFAKTSGGGRATFRTNETALRCARHQVALGNKVEIIKYRYDNTTEVSE